MNRDEHINFIKSNLSDLMREIVFSINLQGDGLEFYAINDYVMQSLLLKMTGAQEQKMKCICWELASDNLNYRYKRYYQKWDLNECSTILDKSKVYGDLRNEISINDPSFIYLNNPSDKALLLNHILDVMNEIFTNTNILKIHSQKYAEFVTIWQSLNPNNLAPTPKLIIKMGNNDNPLAAVNNDEQLYAIYILLYRTRNRYAHNTTAYQLNLPRFYEINDAAYQKYNNMFLFYAELLLIDEMLRTLYDKYQSVVSFA